MIRLCIMFHRFLHEPIWMRPVLQGQELNGRLKCHITRLTKIHYWISWTGMSVNGPEMSVTRSVSAHGGYPEGRWDMSRWRWGQLRWMEPITTKIKSQLLWRLSAWRVLRGKNINFILICMTVCFCMCVVAAAWGSLTVLTQFTLYYSCSYRTF